jgi:hypothetical protein
MPYLSHVERRREAAFRSRPRAGALVLATVKEPQPLDSSTIVPSVSTFSCWGVNHDLCAGKSYPHQLVKIPWKSQIALPGGLAAAREAMTTITARRLRRLGCRASVRPI